MRDQTVSVKHGWIIIFLLNSENGLRKLMPQHIFLRNAFHPAEGRGVSLPRSIPPLALQETVRGSFL